MKNTQITNLCDGDCCDHEKKIEIPVSLLSLLETQMKNSSDLLSLVKKFYDVEDLVLTKEEQEEFDIVTSNVEEALECWISYRDFYEQKNPKEKYPEIKEHKRH